jgi:hypothetical protein
MDENEREEMRIRAFEGCLRFNRYMQAAGNVYKSLRALEREAYVNKRLEGTRNSEEEDR